MLLAQYLVFPSIVFVNPPFGEYAIAVYRRDNHVCLGAGAPTCHTDVNETYRTTSLAISLNYGRDWSERLTENDIYYLVNGKKGFFHTYEVCYFIFEHPRMETYAITSDQAKAFQDAEVFVKTIEVNKEM